MSNLYRDPDYVPPTPPDARGRQFARRARNADAPRYDDLQNVGFRDADANELYSPVEDDPHVRREVYEDMGMSIKRSLQQVRGNGEVHTERRPQSNNSGPSTIREARSMMNRRRATGRADPPDYDESPYPENEEEYYDDEPDPPGRSRSHYRPLVEEQTVAPRRPSTRSNGYSPPAREQSSRPKTATPSRPEFLAPDGSIPTDPCGQRIVFDLNGKRCMVECQEDARTEHSPFHPNMPHMAKLNQPQLFRHGINAFIVWNLDSEAPR